MQPLPRTSDALSTLRAMAESDPELMAALRAAPTRDDFIRIAGQHGVTIDPSDLGEPSDVEISDADLEGAAGGSHPKYGTFTDIGC